jgi:ParB-like chromosome segregation protein Spo0J
MKIEMWEIDRVIPYVRNPRKNDQAVAGVAASLSEFGFQQPLVVDTQGILIAGHTRLKAAQLLKLKQVPVHVAESLTETQAKAYRLLDNKLGEKASWDYGLLGLELEDMKDFNFADYDVDFGDSKDETEVEESGEEDASEKMLTCPKCHHVFKK